MATRCTLVHMSDKSVIGYAVSIDPPQNIATTHSVSAEEARLSQHNL